MTDSEEADLLLQFLRGRDERCPACNYNLRDLTMPVYSAHLPFNRTLYFLNLSSLENDLYRRLVRSWNRVVGL